VKINTLKWLTDENISPQIVLFLRQRGIDVIDVKEQNWHGQEDSYLLKQALLTHRIILTHDADFGTLAINEGQECYGIIYLRLRNLKVQNVKKVLDRLLALQIAFQPGMLIVVEETRVRIH
jgi:predicted nuclease of predicted toxin-antitoxin system